MASFANCSCSALAFSIVILNPPSVFWALPVSTQWHIHSECPSSNTNKKPAQILRFAESKKEPLSRKILGKAAQNAVGKGTGPSNLPKPILASFCHASKNGRKKARKSLKLLGFLQRHLFWCSLMVDTYGYAPDGRSYTFADKNEAFMIQIVSGRHYMAVRIPDDMVAVMPNHYTLHGLNDFPEAYYSPDLVEYAIEKGWYKPRQDGSFEDFDFAKAYAIEEKQHQPYNVLRAKHALQKLMHQKCGNTTNDLPFVCRPNHKVSPRELGNIMSEHYEGTPDDAERVGPGRSPHYSSIRRICTGSTVDSIVCEFSNEALFTKIWTCLGRPCQLPYMPTHPAAGLPKALNSMEKPVERAAKHYLSAPEEMGYSRSVWQRFRDYQNAMDLLYCDTADDGRKLLSDLWNADCEATARAENEARSLIRCGKVENALTLLRETDNLRICKDLDALEMFASQKTRRIDAAPVYLESNQKKSITVTFSCPFEPVEESLIFGLSGRSTSANFACCQQGTLRKHTSGQYTADFSLELLKPDLCAAASFACLLGGTDTTGIPFVGQVMLSLPKTGVNRMCVMADTLRDKNGCKMK